MEILIGAGILLAAAAVIALLVWRRRRWVATFAEAIPAHKQFWRDRRADPGDLLYAAIGDSAAVGIGASDPGKSYVGVIADHIREHTGGSLRVVNLGIAGGTVSTAIDSELPTFGKLRPDIVTVSVGANNVLVFDEAVFERDIRTLFAALPPHALVADLPSFHVLPAERKVRRANRIVRAVAAELGLTVVPLYATTRRYGLWAVGRHFAGDLFHPNDRGYRIWATAFLPAIDRRIAQLDEPDSAVRGPV